jgi:hypothetical protein
MGDEIKRLSETMPGLVELSEMELSAAQAEYDQLLEQHFRLAGKVRLGALTLNAASLVALLSAFSESAAIDAIGGANNAKWIAAFLTLGSIAAVASIFFESVQTSRRVTAAIPRLASAKRIMGLLRTAATQENNSALGKELDGRPVATPIWLRSKASDWLFHASGGIWLGAATIVLIGLLG